MINFVLRALFEIVGKMSVGLVYMPTIHGYMFRKIITEINSCVKMGCWWYSG